MPCHAHGRGTLKLHLSFDNHVHFIICHCSVCLVLIIGNYYLSTELAVTTSHFLRPGKVTEGDLCCAQYAEDHRWYRGRITGLLEGNKVTRGVAS